MMSDLSQSDLGTVAQPGEPVVVVLAASAGGISALETVLAGLPAALRASVVVLQHLDPNHPSLLVDILARHTSLPVQAVRAGSLLTPGVVFVCTPDHHVTIGADRKLHLDDRPRENYVRPSADLLFESAARSVGSSLVAVVLTGTGHDGARGVAEVQRYGGTVIVQDPATAEFAGMPSAAVAATAVDLIAGLGEIAPAVVDFVTRVAGPPPEDVT